MKNSSSADPLAPRLRPNEKGPIPIGRVGYGSYRKLDGKNWVEVDKDGREILEAVAPPSIPLAAATPPPAPTPRPSPVPAPIALTFEERCKAAWDSNPSIRAEFMEFRFYRAYLRKNSGE